MTRLDLWIWIWIPLTVMTARTRYWICGSPLSKGEGDPLRSTCTSDLTGSPRSTQIHSDPVGFLTRFEPHQARIARSSKSFRTHETEPARVLLDASSRNFRLRRSAVTRE
jgi:hypothetical protein